MCCKVPASVTKKNAAADTRYLTEFILLTIVVGGAVTQVRLSVVFSFYSTYYSWLRASSIGQTLARMSMQRCVFLLCTLKTSMNRLSLGGKSKKKYCVQIPKNMIYH